VCGIYGDFARGPLTEEDVRLAGRLTDLVAHRGPDRRGVRVDGRCVFGHRRLTIIDVSERADQPFVSPDRRHMLTYNGEIYNFRDLRRELEARGYRHMTESDTEVLLNGYRCWGEDVLGRLEGMFAFAVFDAVEQRLFAARDHLGQKPLYFARTPAHFLIASELRQLLEHPDVDPRLSVANFQKYLLHECYPWDTTPIEGVHKLPPGSSLACDAELRWTVRRYWDSVPGADRPHADLDGAVEHLLRDSVAKHLIADVPVGVFLSGGLDSSLVAALAAETRANESLETFTAAVQFPSFDEAPAAERVATALGSKHHVFALDEAEAVRCAHAALTGLDEPVADPGIVPSYFISRAARPHVKVALAGDGGDELGAGYITFGAVPLDRVVRRFPGALVSALRGIAGRLPATDRYMARAYLADHFLKAYPAPSLLRHPLWMAPLHPASARRLIAPEWRGRMRSTVAEDRDSVFSELWSVGAPVEGRPLEDQLLYLFQKFYLPGYVCAHTDRAGMLNSLEVRSPFLHRPLVELMNAAPFAAKRAGGRAKLPFRRLAARLLPPEVLAHPKHGFTFPVSAWLRGPLRPLLEPLVTEERIARHGLLDAPAIRSMVADHLAGRTNHQKILWALLVFQTWLEGFPRVRLA
jgi:asparagine synthase (glutamine-hydrolysing)